MAITTMDGLVAAMASGNQHIPLFFPGFSTATGGYLNLNRIASNAHGSASVAPTRVFGGHVPTDVPPGYANITDPTGGKTLYLSRIALSSSTAMTVLIYDRVFAASGFSGTVTGAQVISSPPTLPTARVGTGGDGLELWLESTTPIGATTTTATISYTNSAGTVGRTTLATTTASFPANRMQRVPLQDGDTGVQSVQSVTLAATTGTAGDFSVVLLERKAMISMPLANSGTVMDFADLGLPQIDASSALLFIAQSTSTTTGQLIGSMNLVAG